MALLSRGPVGGTFLYKNKSKFNSWCFIRILNNLVYSIFVDQFRNSNVHQKIFTTRPLQRVTHPWICLSNHYYQNHYTCIFCFNCLNPSFTNTTFPLLTVPLQAAITKGPVKRTLPRSRNSRFRQFLIFEKISVAKQHVSNSRQLRYEFTCKDFEWDTFL